MSGRIRTLKPEWLEDEKLAALTDGARLLSVALVLLADDHGLGRAHPLFLASRTWAYGESHEVLTKVSGALRELEQSGFIRLYAAGGQSYYAIRNWSKHQKVQHPGKPRVPTPYDADGGSHEVLTKPSGDSHEVLAPDLRSPISDHDHDHEDGNETLASPKLERPIDRIEAAERFAIAVGARIGCAYEALGIPWVGAQHRTAIGELSRSVAKLGAVRKQDPLVMLDAWLERFFADDRARKAGYPFAWFVKNPAQYDEPIDKRRSGVFAAADPERAAAAAKLEAAQAEFDELAELLRVNHGPEVIDDRDRWRKRQIDLSDEMAALKQAAKPKRAARDAKAEAAE
jgi:hypothetical protein